MVGETAKIVGDQPNFLGETLLFPFAHWQLCVRSIYEAGAMSEC